MKTNTADLQQLLSRVHVVSTKLDEAKLINDLVDGRSTTAVVSFINQHAFNIACDDAEFRSHLIGSDVLLRDGVGIELSMKILGLDAGLNTNGTDLIPKLLARAGGRTVAVFGTRDPWMSKAVARLRAEGNYVVAALDGFQDHSTYLDAVVVNDPDIIVVAMGMPRQEALAAKIAAATTRPRLILNGGAILDFYAGRFERAPRSIRALRLEWLFRLAQEPLRLGNRYVVGGGLFLFRIVRLKLQSEKRRPA